MKPRNATKQPARVFPTLAGFVDYLHTLPNDNNETQDDSDINNKWAGSSLDTAFKLATYGWPEGAKQASEKALAIVERLASYTNIAVMPEVVYDVSGGSFDVGSYLAGDPECFTRIAFQESKRAIRIVSNIIASGGVPASALMQRGIAVAALALALQTVGHPLTIDITQGSDAARGEDALVRVADASTGSQLDVDRIVFALAHPAMLRRLFRSYTDQRLNVKRHSSKWDNSYVDSDSKPDTGEPIDLFIGGVHLREAERWTDGGESWVIKQFLEQTKER